MSKTIKVKACIRNGKKVAAHTRTVGGSGKSLMSGAEYSKKQSSNHKSYMKDNPEFGKMKISNSPAYAKQLASEAAARAKKHSGTKVVKSKGEVYKDAPGKKVHKRTGPANGAKPTAKATRKPNATGASTKTVSKTTVASRGTKPAVSNNSRPKRKIAKVGPENRKPKPSKKKKVISYAQAKRRGFTGGWD